MSITTLNNFICSGTNADRVAYTPTPATPAAGQSPSIVFLETDTGNTYMWNFAGAAWVQVNTPGAVAYNFIGEAVASGSPAALTVSAIPGTYRHLEVYIIGQDTTSAGSAEMIFNGDTAAHYKRAVNQAYSGGVSGVTTAGVTALYPMYISTAASAPEPATAKLNIPYYAQTTFDKCMSGTSAFALDVSVGAQAMGGTWASTAAITSITLTAPTAWVNGSKMSVYGVN